MMLLASIDGHAVMFWIFTLLTCGFAVAVLFSANIVRMAFYLVLSLGASAGLFFLTGAEFVGAMQLMIYVGGTLVLLIFGVMLTAQTRFITMQTPAGDWILSVFVGGLLLTVLMAAALRVPDWTRPNPDRATLQLEESKTTTQIGLGLAGVRVDRLDQDNQVLRAGMSGYLLPFVIVSVHLLVVLIGAAYMARAKRRATTQETGGSV
ncbi:MAG: NADH-quinone oxidoreductase subunit J [Pirellulaceae bacterium]